MPMLLWFVIRMAPVIGVILGVSLTLHYVIKREHARIDNLSLPCKREWITDNYDYEGRL